jgi:hypothetical protein
MVEATFEDVFFTLLRLVQRYLNDDLPHFEAGTAFYIRLNHRRKVFFSCAHNFFENDRFADFSFFVLPRSDNVLVILNEHISFDNTYLQSEDEYQAATEVAIQQIPKNGVFERRVVSLRMEYDLCLIRPQQRFPAYDIGFTICQESPEDMPLTAVGYLHEKSDQPGARDIINQIESSYSRFVVRTPVLSMHYLIRIPGEYRSFQYLPDSNVKYLGNTGYKGMSGGPVYHENKVYGITVGHSNVKTVFRLFRDAGLPYV